VEGKGRSMTYFLALHEKGGGKDVERRCEWEDKKVETRPCNALRTEFMNELRSR